MNAGLYGDIEDAAVVPIPGSELVLVKNLDVFTPIVDEPHIMGQIAACNVTNDERPRYLGNAGIFSDPDKNTPKSC